MNQNDKYFFIGFLPVIIIFIIIIAMFNNSAAIIFAGIIMIMGWFCYWFGKATISDIY